MFGRHPSSPRRPTCGAIFEVFWQRLEEDHAKKRLSWMVTQNWGGAQDVFQDKMIVRFKCFAFLVNSTQETTKPKS